MQNLLKDLEKLLKRENRFVSDEGALLKNSIIEAALDLDAPLIRLLLTDAKIKEHFFSKVDEVLVFDKVKFQKFISNKEFLIDSYTSFKNKIGLSDGRDGYLKESNDVVLNWPYKDCVLEGGITKEDNKRDEIFYNTILAPDEITRLFDKKVLTGFEKWDAEAVKNNKAKKITEIKNTDNLLIKGNNLIALHCLKERYAGKVKLIYIDPPFNTGNDSFRYNDSFNHSSWLTFMKNRLEIAKTLLKKDGAIFVHCDDNEDCYLKVLLDEIFGRENCVANIALQSSPPTGHKTAHKNKTIIKIKNTIFFYKMGDIEITPQYTFKNNWDSHYSIFLTKNGNKYKRENVIDKLRAENIECTNLNEIDIQNEKVRKFIIKYADSIFCLSERKNNKFAELSRKKKDEVVEENNEAETFLYLNGRFMTPLRKAIKEIDGKKYWAVLLGDFWSDIDFSNTQSEGVISFPSGKKPELLLKRIIAMVTKEGEIVLDFFGGSGTTLAVAHKMGRQWVGVEQMNYIKDLPESRLKKVVEGEQSGISKQVNWQGGGEFIYCELKEWNGAYANDIKKADDKATLKKIYNDIKKQAFYRYDVDLKQCESKDFNALSLEDQKKILLDCLDANHLYVNYSERDDTQYKVSAEDKRLTEKFYGYSG